MNPIFDPATADLIYTLATALGLIVVSALTLRALPWTDQDIAKLDASFRGLGDITSDSIPLRTLS